ncbi:MAG: hypothetical protein ACLFUW_00325 [Bacteroidales bacterium]
MERIRENREKRKFKPKPFKEKRVRFSNDSITPKKSFYEVLKNYRKKKGLKTVPVFTSKRTIGENILNTKEKN